MISVRTLASSSVHPGFFFFLPSFLPEDAVFLEADEAVFFLGAEEAAFFEEAYLAGLLERPG